MSIEQTTPNNACIVNSQVPLSGENPVGRDWVDAPREG